MVRNRASSAPARARLEPGVDVVGARRRLERRRAGSPGRGGRRDATRWRPRSRWSAGGGDDRPRLDRDRRLDGPRRAAAGRGRGTRPRETVIRTEASPVGPSRPSAASRSAIPRSTSALGDVAGSAMSRPAGRAREAGDVLGELGRRGRRAPRSVSKMPSPSWKPRSKTERCGASAGQERRRRPRRDRGAARGVAGHPCHLDRADRAERAARLGHGLVPLGRRVAAPGDPAADVEA